jgi:CRISPR-associated protein Cas1
VNGGRVEFLTEEKQRAQYWNIPIANTTTILLGTGTSITQAAMRELGKAGVMVGFCGGGGTPLFTANEMDVEVAWFSPQSEYRPTEYLQHWVAFWFDDEARLRAAKAFQLKRLELVQQQWSSNRLLRDASFSVDVSVLTNLIASSKSRIEVAADTTALLTEEARLTKDFFKMAARAVKYGEFTRAKKGTGTDPANRFLDHGNYLAYGLAATATWVLGLPHGLAVLHGKTRRGGLVFDAADLIKDALILPQAFISANRGDAEQQFRNSCIELLTRAEALDTMIETLKEIAVKTQASKQ